VSHGNIRPLYNRRLRTFEESMEHGHYVISTYKNNLLDYFNKKQENLSYFSRDILKKFASKYVGPYFLKKVASSGPKSKVFRSCAKLLMKGINRTSYNVNVKGQDPRKLEKNFIWRNMENLF